MTSTLFEAKKSMVDSAFIRVGKLNKREYRNTILDLFGVELDLKNLTEDGILEGFDRVGDAQSLSDVDFEEYLKLGELAVDRALHHMNLDSHEVEHKVEIEGFSNPKVKRYIASAEKLIESAKHALKIGEDGEKQKNKIKGTQNRLAKLKQYMDHPMSKSGMLLHSSYNIFGNFNTATLEIRPRVAGQKNKKRKGQVAHLNPGRYKVTYHLGFVDRVVHQDLVWVIYRPQRG